MDKTEQTRLLGLIADQLRALTANGIHYVEDPYQVERLQQIRGLAAQLQSIVDERPSEEIDRIFSTDLEVKTPLSVVDTAVFDPDGKLLLIRRRDNDLWALPGGACDVGDTPAESGAREVKEETGIDVEITRLLGVFDSRICGSHTTRHLYHFLFAGAAVGGTLQTSIETSDVAWFVPADIPWQALSHGHPYRIQFALQWWLNPGTHPYFDPYPQTP